MMVYTNLTQWSQKKGHEVSRGLWGGSEKVWKGGMGLDMIKICSI